MRRYFQRETGPATVDDGASVVYPQTTDSAVDWLDDDELLSSELLDSLVTDVSSPKKPRVC